MTSCSFLFLSRSLTDACFSYVILFGRQKTRTLASSANSESHRINYNEMNILVYRAKQEQTSVDYNLLYDMNGREMDQGGKICKVLRALRWIQHMVSCCGCCCCVHIVVALAARLAQKQATVCPILKNKLPSSWQPSHRKKIKQSPLAITMHIDMMIYTALDWIVLIFPLYEHTACMNCFCDVEYGD